MLTWEYKHSHSQTTDDVLSLCVVSSLADTLLDDFLLTYPVFMSTSDLCQALLGQYPSTHWKPLLPLTFIRNNLLLLSAKRAARRTQRHSCSADNTHTHTHLLFHLVCLMSANRASTCEVRKKRKGLNLLPPPPTAPSSAEPKRTGGSLRRGSAKSCTWCRSGWRCAEIS